MSEGKGLGGLWVGGYTVMSAWTGMKSHQSALLTFVAYWTRFGLVQFRAVYNCSVIPIQYRHAIYLSLICGQGREEWPREGTDTEGMSVSNLQDSDKCIRQKARTVLLNILWTVFCDTHAWERSTSCTHFLSNLLQLDYPVHVSNEQVHHQEIISVHTSYSISHDSHSSVQYFS